MPENDGVVNLGGAGSKTMLFVLLILFVGCFI